MSTAPRIPRLGRAHIPVGSRNLWIELPPLVRIAVGLAVGSLLLALLS